MEIEIKITGRIAVGKTYAAREMIEALRNKFNDVEVVKFDEIGVGEIWHVSAGARK